MKKTFLAIALVTLVAACGERDAPDAVQAPNTDSAAAGPDRPARARQLEQALPEGVELGFRYHLRNDEVLQRPGRPARRRVGLEYLEGDQQSVFESIDGSLVSAGFAERDRSSPQSGNIRVKYAKKGIGTVIVTVTPPGDEKTYHEDGIGRVLLDWPRPRSTAAKQTSEQ